MSNDTTPMTVNAPVIQIAATTTASASVNVPVFGNPQTIRLVNEGPDNCYVSVGPGSQTATLPSGTASATSTPVLAGTDITLSLPTSLVQCQISAITAAGTATLDVQVGLGL